MRRPNKETRAQAILLCAIAASAEWPPIYAERIAIDVSQEATDLADDAADVAATDWLGSRRAVWAEAEAMLQTGWMP